MVTSANMSKYYHGNLIERTQALVFALTGNYGKRGSGFVGFPWLDHDGLEGFIRDMFSLKDMMHPTALKIIGKTIADNVRWRHAGYSGEMINHETGRDIIASGRRIRARRSGSTSTRSRRSSALMRLWTWVALVFLARKRSMKRSVWAIWRSWVRRRARASSRRRSRSTR